MSFIPGTAKGRILFVGILAFGLILRSWGLTWGLPSERNWFSLHPDEIDVIGAAARLPDNGFNPGFFNYGSLTIYLTYAVGRLVQIPSEREPLLSLRLGGAPAMKPWRDLHLVGRWISVVFGLLTIPCVFSITRFLVLLPTITRRDSEAVEKDSLMDDANAPQLTTLQDADNAGLYAAALFGGIPGHVMHSHYSTVDVPSTFFVAACAAFASRMFVSNYTRWLMLASACAGLAAGAKYSCALALLMVFAALVLADWKGTGLPSSVPPPWSTSIPLAIIPFAVAFLLACPFSVLDASSFYRDLLFELRRVRSGSGLIFVGVGPGWWNHININMPYAVTSPILLVALAGWVFGLKERHRGIIFLSAFVIPYSLVIGAAITSYLRYTIPLIPFMIAIASWFLFTNNLLSRVKPLLCAVLLLIVLIAGAPAVYLFGKTDARIASADWLEKRVKNEERIGLITPPWFWTATLTPLNGGGRTAGLFERSEDARRFNVLHGWDAGKLEKEHPEWFVMSEFEFRDEIRLGQENAKTFFEVLLFYYEPVRVFKGTPPLTLPGRNLWTPHDWLYPNPEIRIYRRKL